MQEAINTKEEETSNVETVETETTENTETVDETATENVDTTVDLNSLSVDELKTKRMGSFKVGISHGDAVYYRNILDKSEYVGPQQAYLLVVAKSEMSQICNILKEKDKNSRWEVGITSATIESLGFFMNKYVGKGSDSATKLFTASMLLRPVMAEINKIDEILKDRSTK